MSRFPKVSLFFGITGLLMKLLADRTTNPEVVGTVGGSLIGAFVGIIVVWTLLEYKKTLS